MTIDEKIKELEERKEVILKTIDELKKEKENKFKRWRAKSGFRYFYLGDDGIIRYATDFYNMSDDYRYATGNYFETEAEALRYKQNLITYQHLKNIALRLNEGRKFDWNDLSQRKYYIYFDFKAKELKQWEADLYKILNVIYCRDEDFLEVALKEIGEEKLKQFLEWGI